MEDIKKYLIINFPQEKEKLKDFLLTLPDIDNSSLREDNIERLIDNCFGIYWHEEYKEYLGAFKNKVKFYQEEFYSNKFDLEVIEYVDLIKNQKPIVQVQGSLF